MANAPHIVDITAGNFESEVVNRSHQVPVVVDFWAAWCGPCKTLMPLLTQLADEYAGQFVLAKVNIDEQQELAMQFGVRSVPTVKVFRFGGPVDEFMGVQPEPQIRAIIDRYIERESDRHLAAALERYEQGDIEGGLNGVRAVLAAEPENRRAQLVMAELLVASGDYAEARQLVESLPADLRMADEVEQLMARLDLAEAADGAAPIEQLQQRLAANPGDSEARYQLAMQCLAGGAYEEALETFLELMRRDRAYGEDAGRKGMLKAFELLGDHELVGRYRRKMAQVLY